MDLRPRALTLVVADMGATLAFYRRLGLDLADGMDSEAHVEATFAGVALFFDTEETTRSVRPNWERPTGDGRISLGFHCETAAELDAVWTELTGAGYAGLLAPWNAFWGSRHAVIADPDGNPVELGAPLTGA